MDDIINKLLDKAKKQGADFAEAICVEELSNSVSYRLNKIEDMDYSLNKSFGLKVVINKKKATVSFSNIKSIDIDELVTQAISMAKYVPVNKNLIIATKEQISNKKQDFDQCSKEDISTENLKDWAHGLEEQANKR